MALLKSLEHDRFTPSALSTGEVVANVAVPEP